LSLTNPFALDPRPLNAGLFRPYRALDRGRMNCG
jgi:hypothetical protein